jgi:hypothetical protein
MDHRLTLSNATRDLVLDGVAVWPIVLGDDQLALGARQPTSKL